MAGARLPLAGLGLPRRRRLVAGLLRDFLRAFGEEGTAPRRLLERRRAPRPSDRPARRARRAR
jgi:hypothetical protein